MPHRHRMHSRSWNNPRKIAHPHSPAGGGGPGHSRKVGVAGLHAEAIATPNAEAPASRFFEWHSLMQTFETTQRAEAVYDAIDGAGQYMAQAIYKATGQELHEVLAGILPGFLMMLGVLALTTSVGAAAGAALGFFAFGVGAAPGAAVGAGVGLDAGAAILEYLGLAFLVVYIGKSLLTAAGMAGDAVKLAWNCIDHPGTRNAAVEQASKKLADAVAQAFRGVLQGLVAFLIAKGTAAAASRVPELAAKLRSSKLGAGFAEWVEKNWMAVLRREGVNPGASRPREIDMIRMLSKPKPGEANPTIPTGATERGMLARNLKGKFVIRGEGMGDKGPGNFFNGPYKSLAEAEAAAKHMAASGEAAMRDGNAVVRVWPDGSQSKLEVVRIYEVDYEGTPGFVSVIASQPESGSVMLRPEHLKAIAQKNPSIAHEYKGGNMQVEMPVGPMRMEHKINIVKRVGKEHPVKKTGTGFHK